MNTLDITTEWETLENYISAGTHLMTGVMLHSIKMTHAIEGLEKWASRTGLPDGVADKIITELGDIFGLTDSEIARILEGGN